MRWTNLEIPVGGRFGELVVLGGAPKSGHVLVRCDCGVEYSARLRSILAGRIKKCGRSSHWDREMIAKGDAMNGQRFGTLVVVRGTSERGGRRGCMVWVRCDCGTEKAVAHTHLVRGMVASCGGDAHRSIARQVPARWTRRQTNITYAIEAVGLDRIKIGVAADLRERLLKLQYPCPVELVVIASSESNLEHRLHSELDRYRLHGEWFRKTPEVVAAIQLSLTPCRVSVIGEIGSGRRGRVQGRKYRCARCGELGHFAKTCAKPLGDASI